MLFSGLSKTAKNLLPAAVLILSLPFVAQTKQPPPPTTIPALESKSQSPADDHLKPLLALAGFAVITIACRKR